MTKYSVGLYKFNIVSIISSHQAPMSTYVDTPQLTNQIFIIFVMFIFNILVIPRCVVRDRKNEYFEKISLAPKICEMYLTISLKLFLNFHQLIIEEINATVELILLLVNS